MYVVVFHWAPTFVPFAQLPTAPTRRTFVATPEVASEAVRAMFTVPLTIPPGAVFETATVEVGRVVSILTRTPPLSAVPNRASDART